MVILDRHTYYYQLFDTNLSILLKSPSDSLDSIKIVAVHNSRFLRLIQYIELKGSVYTHTGRRSK